MNRRYFVVNHEGNPDTKWWNSKENEAAYIDFTKPEAAEWYTNRLKKLQKEAGIDSYKFDAGESCWIPAVSESLLFYSFHRIEHISVLFVQPILF